MGAVSLLSAVLRSGSRKRWALLDEGYVPFPSLKKGEERRINVQVIQRQFSEVFWPRSVPLLMYGLLRVNERFSECRQPTYEVDFAQLTFVDYVSAHR